ncbi:galectin-3-binding protein A-like [Brienomyrus brachyistius]|uniref:galectin-3-binding protein A-like n=1 Tax=Brienomyrus brachyistius TaxID=42636 RepID=UPI0020B2EDC8|nr:galectin-3-binding protein A-like [Brienomyrus brachyistius]XP_048847143.1 galectin-3-binding protein A-like [Brienomyrus brachyistius]
MGKHVISSVVWLLLLWLSVSCSAIQEGDLRLVGGQLLSEGRVEIYHDGQWGTVCDDSWDVAEAQVVCRQLRYPGALSATQGGKYGQGSGPIWLDDLGCLGTESRLSGCRFKGWGVTDCSHGEDAGVVCERNLLQENKQVYTLDDISSLREDLERLFNNGQDCDLNVTVQSPDRGESFCLHRLVLSMSHESSTIMFLQDLDTININVTQACQPYVSKFLRYLYTRKIDITISSVKCIHQLATDFRVKSLQEGAGRLFSWLLPGDPTFKSQVVLYEYAVQAADRVLQETCMQFLAWNCEALIDSPAWSDLSQNAMSVLMSRSDVVVPDEAFLLKGLESWILAQHGDDNVEWLESLLGLVRFPMIPAEKLYDLQFISDLYPRHKELYREGMLRGFQFNTVPFHKLKDYSNISKAEYTPRIYTGSPWSLVVNVSNVPSSYQYNYQYGYRGYNSRARSFETPLHNSLLFHSEKIGWSTDIFLNNQECQNRGLRCEYVPAAWMGPDRFLQYQNITRFSNKLLLNCEGSYIFQIQDFKNNLALVPSNSTMGQSYPCDSGDYKYHFVVQPQYEL